MAKEKTQFVTIPFEEYKTLLLKEKPKDSINTLLNELLQALLVCVVYTESTYYSSYIGDNLKLNDDVGTKVADFFKKMKYADIDMYMEIWNRVMTNHRKEEEMKAKMEQMKKAKEIRNEEK